MVRCPECGARFVGRARVERLAELIRSLVTIYPFRCQLCGHRFSAFRGRPTYTPRREFRRVPLHCPVWFRMEPAPPAQAIQGEGVVVDLSIRGCAVESVTPIPGSIRLQLRLRPTDSPEPIEIEHAVVRHVRGNRFGAEFVHMSLQDRGRLRRILEAQLAHHPLGIELN